MTPGQIADTVTEKGTPVSVPVVRDWLEDMGLGLRKIHKVLAGGVSPDRDAQFQRIGKQCYPNAKSILLLCDSGGSNSASHYIFKSDLQDLVNELGIEIRVAHYPSYCSKYNPIEHRLFPHITRSCQGMLFDTLETAVRLMRRAATRTGLRTTVNVIRGLYEIGRSVATEFKTNMTILFDELMPKLNYRAVPQ